MAIGPIKKGAFHRFLGKKADAPITAADIAKGEKAGGHAAKMANFAKNAKKWHHKGKKKGDGEHAHRMYGEGSKSKRETSSKANLPARQHIKGLHHGQ